MRESDRLPAAEAVAQTVLAPV
eukprot:SAG31_NODE_34097_length_336_cov_1.097046_1_plen_21_part_10